MEKVKAITTCKICGRGFPLIIEEHYVARDPKSSGVIAALASTDKAYEYDAIDCPYCGCQNILRGRKPKVCPCDYGYCGDCEDECLEEQEDPEDGE